MFPGQPMWPRPVQIVTANYLGPDSMAASRDGKTLYIALADARQLAFFDVAGGKIAQTVTLPAEPTGMALAPDGARLYVTCAAVKSTVAVIDTVAGKIVASIPAGHTAHGIAVTPDGKRLYVCNRFNNDVSVIETAGQKQIARVAPHREPYAAVATPDGKSVFVVNHLPLDRADEYDVAANVSVIDTATNQAASVRLPNGSSSVRGIAALPDGRYVYVVHILSHFELPATQLERGWVNTNAMTIIDAGARKILNTVLLDDVDLGAAMPWGVTASGDGKSLFVTHAGTHELSVIDASALMDKLLHLAPAAAAEVPNDLALLATLRRRVRLPGNGPHGLSVIGDRAYVAEHFSDTLAVVDLKSQAAQPVIQVPLGPTPQLIQERRGEMLFFDATICFQHWQACGSCHPDARVDGLNWDLPNDGLGNPKNTRNLLHVFHGGPAMSLGVRENAGAAVRAGITHVLFAVRPEEDAIALDAYLMALSARAQSLPGRRQAQPCGGARQAALLQPGAELRRVPSRALLHRQEIALRGEPGQVRQAHRPFQHAPLDRGLADGPLHARRALPHGSRGAFQGAARPARRQEAEALAEGHRRPCRVRQQSLIESELAFALQVLRSQAGSFGNSGQHPRTNLVVVMKGEYEIGPICAFQYTVGRARMAFDTPANPQQSGKYSTRLRGWPTTHATTAKTRSNSGTGSP